MGDEQLQQPISWGWVMVAGILLTAFGFIGLFMEVFLTFAGTIFLGAFVFMGGLAQFISIFKIEGWGSRLAFLLLSIVYIISGLIIILFPALSAEWITAFIALTLIIVGVFRIGGGLSSKGISAYWGAIVISGLLSVALGVLIWMSWPEDSQWVIGMFLAIEMLFQGLSLITIASAAKQS